MALEKKLFSIVDSSVQLDKARGYWQQVIEIKAIYVFLRIGSVVQCVANRKSRGRNEKSIPHQTNRRRRIEHPS